MELENNWVTKWRSINIENQELRLKILDIFLNSIYDYEDEWVFMFNHKDGTKTLKKADVDKVKTCSNLNAISPPIGYNLNSVFIGENVG